MPIYREIEMKNRKKIILIILAACFLLGSVPFIINGVVVVSSKKYIVEPGDAADFDADCILVFGAGVRPDGTPSHMLYDRIKRGVELYELGASDRLLMSGDHGRKGYDEVNTMKNYAADMGVDRDVIFMDHAGFSTYESVYRAGEIFGVERVVVVTQQYHLYRAVYIARQFGLEAVGVNADYRTYGFMGYNNAREFLARCKAFIYCIFKPEPTYLGEPIPISGSASLTDD